MKTRLISISLLAIIIFFSVACNHNNDQKNLKDTVRVIDPDDTIAGRKVESTYPSGAPNEVNFYRVDENGNVTDELIRKVFYFDNDVKQSNGLKQKYIEGSIRNDSLRDGVWKAYHRNGKLQVSATYRLGISVGEEKVYYENGQLAQLGHYDQTGCCTGEWKFYGEDGKEVKIIVADANTVVCRSCPKCKTLLQKDKEAVQLSNNQINKSKK